MSICSGMANEQENYFLMHPFLQSRREDEEFYKVVIVHGYAILAL